MIYKIQVSVLIAFLAVILASCNAKEPKTSSINNKRVNGLEKMIVENDKYDLPFDSLLDNVNNNIKGIWDPPIRMDGNKYFMILYNNPNKYYEDFLRVMKNRKYEESKKMISVFAAQQLDFDRYLDLSNYCAKMFRNGTISDNVIFFILFPNGWKTKWRYAEKYSDPRVHKLLAHILDSKGLSERSRIILDRLYTGIMWKEYKSNLEKGFPVD